MGRRVLLTGMLAALGGLVLGLLVAQADPLRPRERPAQQGARQGADHGQFASPCRFSHRASDDPIGDPGDAGGSHSHDFFGNRSTNASSTQASMRAAGATSCRRAGDTAGYWVPTLSTLLREITPSGATIYYRNAGKDPASIQPPPAGLKVIAGDAGADGPQDTRVVSWGCGAGSGISGRSMPPRCPRGTRLVLVVRFPDCWDGANLDSSDHQSHLAYATKIRGRRGRACPASHAAALPALAMHVRYPTRGGRLVRLSSGPAYTAHADFLNAWDQDVLDELVRRCLNANVKCGRT
jgi:hypothetical protein